MCPHRLPRFRVGTLCALKITTHSEIIFIGLVLSGEPGTSDNGIVKRGTHSIPACTIRVHAFVSVLVAHAFIAEI